ncbi:ATP-binding protein [Uniformispora flossi]|uniref:ATP-binding protein n=1 Tax=Uniformispora flossi TaxID=3390723 RepID=UPI003C2B6274
MPGIGVLGTLRVAVGGRAAEVAGRRDRGLLALLAARCGAAVAAERLVDELWGDDAPPSAAASLQVAVSRLRAVLEPGRKPRAPAAVLVSTERGYALRLPDGALDAQVFARTLAEGHALLPTDPAAALAALDAALALWRGDAYADFPDLAALREDADRLDELRLLAAESRLDALTALGRHGEAAADAESLVRRHPFRERFTELLVLSLYRGGRQADALAALRAARARLAEELGVEPSPALRRLERDVLEHATHLADGMSSAARTRDAVPVPAPAETTPPHDVPSDLPTARTRTADSGEPAARAAAPLPPPLPALVGRDAQLAALHRALDDAAAARGGVVIVSGEPGIGKTHLVAEFARRATAKGVRTVWGRCHEADPAPAFWPWTEVLRAVQSPARAGASGPSLLGREARGRGLDLDLDPATAPLRVYEETTRHLLAVAGEQPLVVVLEDLHWADPSSLHLLQYAAEPLAHTPVLLVATLRDTERRENTALDACLAAVARTHPVRLPLEGLGPADTRTLVSRVVGADIDDATAAAVYRRVAGNPFFTRELARLMTGHTAAGPTRTADRVSGGPASDPDGTDTCGQPGTVAPGIGWEIPDGVRDVVRRRLAPLPTDARTVLQAAAAFGRDFGADLLIPVAGLDLAAVADALDTATGHGLLDEVPSPPGHYRFTHALVRETVYEDLGPARRRALHGRIGTALEARLGDAPDRAAEIAHHLLLGAQLDPALTERAILRCVAAARHADEQFAYDEAGALWRRAADIVAASPETPPALRFDILHGLGVALRRTGDLAGSREVLRAALTLARDVGEPADMAAAAVAFGGPELWNWREYAEVDHDVIAVLEHCRAALPDGDLHAQVTAGLAVELVYTWDGERADRLSLEAVRQARAGGDPQTLGFALSCRFLAIWRPGTAVERLAIAEELATAAQATGSPHTGLVARFLRACALLELGRTDEADADIARCEDLAAGQGQTSAAVQLAWWHCMRHIMAGRAADARAGIPGANRLHRQTTVAGPDECEGTLRAESATAAGTLADELPALADLARRSRQPVFRAVIARAALAAGDHALAAELVPEATDPTVSGTWSSLALDCLRTEVLAGLGRTAELPACIGVLAPHADAIALYGSIDMLGSVRHFLGIATAALGDSAAAAAHFTAAAACNDRIGARLWADRSRARLAALRDDGRRVPRGGS